MFSFSQSGTMAARRPSANTPARAGATGSGRFHSTVEWITSLEALEAIAAEWTALEAVCPYPAYFQSYGWISNWARRFADGDDASYRLAIATVRHNGRLVAALPLAQSRQLSGTYLVGVGEPLAQYDDVLIAAGVAETPVLEAIWTQIKRWPGIDGLRLKRVRVTSPLAAFVRNRRQTRLTGSDYAPMVDLAPYAGEPARYHAGLRAQTRKRLKRYENSLSKLGQVEFRVLEGGPEAREMTQRALELKEAWLRHKGMTSRMFMSEAFKGCLLDMAGNPDSNLRTAALMVDGKPIAIEIACLDHDHLGSFLGAFDLAYRDYRPGQIQIANTIAWAIREGLTTYDLLPPDADYKRHIATDCVSVVDFVRPLSLRGWLDLCVWHGSLRQHLKSAFYTLPDALRVPAVRWLHG